MTNRIGIVIGFTPSTVVMHVEGGGPADYFRFVGDLAVQQVPEPGFSTLLSTAAVLALLGAVRRRSKLLGPRHSTHR